MILYLLDKYSSNPSKYSSTDTELAITLSLVLIMYMLVGLGLDYVYEEVETIRQMIQ